MANPLRPARLVRVGDFQLDLESGDLIGRDTRVRLQVQSLELLKALLEQPGTMVGRDALRQRLWPGDTFVDFDHGLNAAVRRLREALGDTADAPRFIETIPRKGYRLVSPADTSAATIGSAWDVDTPPLAERQPAAPDSWTSSSRGWAIAAALVVALAAGASLWKGQPPVRRSPVGAFTIDLPAGWNMRPLDTVALSPDSRYVAFTAVGPHTERALWVRPLADRVPRQVVGTGNPLSPFWSPDSSRIGFFQLGQLSAVSLADASTQLLAVLTPSGAALQTGLTSKLDVSEPLLGGAATWMDNGDIVVFTPLHGPGLRRLARGASALVPLPSDAEPGKYRAPWPHAIPGTDRFTSVGVKRGTSERVGRIGTLGVARSLELAHVDSRLVPTGSGHVVFVRDGTLVAQRLDITKGFVGHPAVLADDVAVRLPTLGHFSATSDVLVHLTREALRVDMSMRVVDRRGRQLSTIGDPGFYSSLRMSPDGSRIAVGLQDVRLGTRDIWIYDLSGTPALRLTFDASDDMGPGWSQDGRTLLFTSDRSGERDIYRKDASGRQPETLVFASAESKSINAWSRDGRFLVYDTGARGSLDAQGRLNRADLFTLFLDGPARVRPLANTPAHEAIADIAPDGALVAYASSETGGSEVFVETFPEKGGRWQVTTTGAFEPLWRGDGRELFFLTSGNEVAAVDVVRSGGGIRFGPQRVLFKREGGTVDQVRSYAPAPDGQRFVVLTETSNPKPQQLMVRMNWRSLLRDD